MTIKEIKIPDVNKFKLASQSYYHKNRYFNNSDEENEEDEESKYDEDIEKS